MAAATRRCPHGQSEAVVKDGKASTGKERLRCPQPAQCGRTVLGSSADPGCLPTVKQQRVEMTLKGRGRREMARVRQVGPNTVRKELKKASGLSQVNTRGVEGGCPDAVTVAGRRVEAAEVEERWSCVQRNAQQRG